MRYVIIGGGVAGVACYEELSRVCKEGDSVTLLSATDTVKCVTKVDGSGRILEELEVAERPLSSLDAPSYSGSSVSLRVVQCAVSRVDTEARVVHLAQGDEVPFDRLCLCTGAVPRVPPRIQHDHPLMLCVRDSGSIHALRATLGLSRRVVVVGNGGIALGLLSEAPSLPSTCELHWVVREDYLGGTFLAATASDFLLEWAAEQRKAGGGAAGAPPSITVASGGDAVEDTANSITTAQDLDYGVSASMFSHHISVEDQIGGGGSGGCGGGGGGEEEEEVGSTSAPPPLLSSPLPQRQSTKGRLQRKQQALLSQAQIVSHEGGGGIGEGVASKPPPPPPLSAGGSGLSAFSSGAPPIPTAFHPPPQTSVRFGASLGPHWAQSLALSRGEGNASGGASFTVTRRAEVSAIRGVPGTPGAVGEFSSGEWVDLTTTTPESSSLSSSLPPPPPPPSPPHNAPCGAEGGGGGGDVALPPLSHAPLPWPLQLLLSSGEVIGCDAVVWAIGVTPSIPPLTPSPAILHHSDGGLIVNPHMQISGGGGRVYAAGDCASVLWPRAPISTATTSSSTAAGVSALPLPHPPLPLWFQMRTWGQALTTGAYAARCMAGVTKESLEDGDGGVAFQAFSHTTRVLGLKTVLLGAFNGQGLGEAWERVVRGGRVKGGEGGGGSSLGGEKGAGASVGSPWGKVHLLLRVTPGVEFVQVVVVGGRVVGALLMGETDLEETMENLILNGTNVRVKRGGGGRGKGGREEEGEEEEETLLDLLNPDLELEDYFD